MGRSQTGNKPLSTPDKPARDPFGRTTWCGKNGIILKPYEEIYDYAGGIPAGETVLLDENIVNYRIVHSLKDDVKTVRKPNPTEWMKAVKNEAELSNIRNAHIKDGVAFTKFVCYRVTISVR